MHNSKINKITSARAVGAHVLELTFRDGYVGRIDLTPALWGAPFESLRDPVAFRQFRVEDDTVRWSGGADFCPDVLRFWCEAGSVRSQAETDAYFTQQLARVHSAEVAEMVQ